VKRSTGVDHMALGPGIGGLWLLDPTLPLDGEVGALLLADRARPSRRWLLGPSRPASRLAVAVVRAFKVLAPRSCSHRLLDVLCLGFLRRAVAPESTALLLRHFQVETALVDFLAANLAPGAATRVSLRPTTIRELDGGVVLAHDDHLYRCLAELGAAVGPGGLVGDAHRLAAHVVDASMLHLLPVDPDGAWPARRWLSLDLETALCWMNVAFCALTTRAEYERAVHSLTLDASVLDVLVAVTGDARFAALRPPGSQLQVRTHRDVPAELHHHAVVDELALGLLRSWCGVRGQARHGTIGPSEQALVAST
jgi:hypothetical protein